MPATSEFTSPSARARYLELYDAAMRCWPVQSEARVVGTRFGDTQTYRCGPSEGTPVVLLHGQGGTSAMWAPNVAALSEHGPVIAVDTIGEAGRSVQTRPISDSADRARWLTEVLDELDIEFAHLAGASYGGWMGLNQALHTPERVRSLLLLDPAQAIGRLRLRWLAFAGTASLSRREWLVRRFVTWANGGEAEASPITDLFAHGIVHHRQRIPAPVHLSDAHLAAIATPVLLLLGGQSTVHDSARVCERAVRTMPNVTAEVLPEAGHGLSGQAATEVNERMRRFLGAIDGCPRA